MTRQAQDAYRCDDKRRGTINRETLGPGLTNEGHKMFKEGHMNKYFLMLVGALTLGLSACASIDRSTASDESVQADKPSSLDRNSQF
jgi:hypothetical protein